MEVNDKVFSDQLCELVNKKSGALVESNESINEVKVTPIARIYCYVDVLGLRIFDEEEDLIYFYSKYASKDGIIYVSEYLGDMFGSTDVIRRVFLDGNFQICALRDLETYSVLEINNYISSGQVLWGFTYGSLRDEFFAFKRRGIEFKNNLYLEEGPLYDRFKAFGRKKVLDL